jgi:threonyl-tRNA synthetase
MGAVTKHVLACLFKISDGKALCTHNYVPHRLNMRIEMCLYVYSHTSFSHYKIKTYKKLELTLQDRVLQLSLWIGFTGGSRFRELELLEEQYESECTTCMDGMGNFCPPKVVVIGISRVLCERSITPHVPQNTEP